jgi:hypothetical protein
VEFLKSSLCAIDEVTEFLDQGVLSDRCCREAGVAIFLRRIERLQVAGTGEGRQFAVARAQIELEPRCSNLSMQGCFGGFPEFSVVVDGGKRGPGTAQVRAKTQQVGVDLVADLGRHFVG